MIFALIGNQNCGKTTLFNQLTGSNQHVGNFPGVTVDSKSGSIRSYKDSTVVDLPGIYSLRPYTNEEIVTRDFLLNTHPDGIINIIDATNIERNLYLTTQLLTMGIPTVIALNMMDEVRNSGGTIDVNEMSSLLGVPVVPISASKNEGVSELIDIAMETAKNRVLPKVTDFCSYGPIHRCIHAVIHLIEDHAQRLGVAGRFCATSLILTSNDFADRLGINQNERELIEHSIVEMESEVGMDRDAAIADMSYTYIEGVCDKCVVKVSDTKEHIRSAKIDKVLTNKYAALPIFLLIMATIFAFTFLTVGQWLSELIEQGIDGLASVVVGALESYGLNVAMVDLIEKGIFGGLGAVVSLLPYIVLLFLCLSLLEDSGYMARIAFIMDKPLRKIGLSGRSFVPIIVGFGCSVPAIMSTRTLASERDKRLTIMLIPFVSCSAKAIVYSAIVSAGGFTAIEQLGIIMGLYILGVILGVIVALITGKTLMRGNPVPFVMELPNYRLPSFKSVMLLMWEKAKDFLTKAFTVIFLATLIIWFLQAYNSRLVFITEGVADDKSLLAIIGDFVSPIFRPIGLGDGKIVSSLIAGFTAKEAVVSTIEMLIGGANISVLFPTDANLTASILSFLTFILLYTPCVATIATVKRELNSTLKTAGVVVFQCVVAYVMALIVYNIALI